MENENGLLRLIRSRLRVSVSPRSRLNVHANDCLKSLARP